MKLNYMKIKNNIMTWKQVETRGSRIFMRAKNRPFISVKMAHSAIQGGMI